MKTTIEIGDALLDEARAVAVADGTTLRALVEEGLRASLATRRSHPPYVLPDLATGEGGLVRGLQWHDWNRLRDLIYEDRAV
jgi:hypothetical protein